MTGVPDVRSESVTDNLDRPFAIAGRRGYLIGHMDGSFPDLGHHIPGEMGGLWTPPVKLADGHWFAVREQGQCDWQWLHNERFTMHPGGASADARVRLPHGAVRASQTMVMALHPRRRPPPDRVVGPGGRRGLRAVAQTVTPGSLLLPAGQLDRFSQVRPADGYREMDAADSQET